MTRGTKRAPVCPAEKNGPVKLSGIKKQHPEETRVLFFSKTDVRSLPGTAGCRNGICGRALPQEASAGYEFDGYRFSHMGGAGKARMQVVAAVVLGKHAGVISRVPHGALEVDDAVAA